MKIKRDSHRKSRIVVEKRSQFLHSMREEFDIEAHTQSLQMNNPERDESGESDESEEDQLQVGSDSTVYTNSTNDDESDDADYMPPTKKHKSSKPKIKISPDVVQALDSAGVSNCKATSILLTCAKLFGIDLNNVTASESTMKRHREKFALKSTSI